MKARRSFAACLLAVLMATAVESSSAATTVQLTPAMTKSWLTGLFAKLRVLTIKGDEHQCMTAKQREDVCYDDDALAAMAKIATTCGVTLHIVKNLHRHPPTNIRNQATLDDHKSEQDCVMREDGWTDQNGALQIDEIKKQGLSTPIGSNITAVVDDALNRSGRISWDSVSRFSASGQEDDLMPATTTPNPQQPDKNQLKLTKWVERMMFLTLVNRPWEVACLEKAKNVLQINCP